MSQERLGEAIGLTFQQVQKYERGSNRISAGTLFRLSQVLEVPVSFFFDLYDDPQHPQPAYTTTSSAPLESGGISRREARLLRLWRAAPPPIGDEILALLGALSPSMRDGREAGGDDHAAVDDTGTPAPDADSAAGESSGRESARPADRGTSARPRRRHGAVWDPTDIYRTTKEPPSGR